MPKQLMSHNRAVESETSAKADRRRPDWERDSSREGRTMAKEPDNLVLKMLREIRARLDRHEQRFDKIDKKLDDMSESLTYALGLSLKANVQHESVQKQLDALAQRVQRLEERL
jgi:polyhydroxyalkanoate synthesis regulator phasin